MLDPILQILVNNGYIDEDGAADLQDLAKTEAKSVRQLVIDQEIITEDVIYDIFGIRVKIVEIDHHKLIVGGHIHGHLHEH